MSYTKCTFGRLLIINEGEGDDAVMDSTIRRLVERFGVNEAPGGAVVRLGAACTSSVSVREDHDS